LQNREALVRSYADHVTHEMKSPLTSLRGAAELLDDTDLAPAHRAKMLANIKSATARMEALLDSQRAFAAVSEPVAPGAARLSAVVAKFPAAQVVTDGQVPLAAEVLTVLATHLIDNATKAGATSVSFDWRSDHLRISDNGPGISDGNRSRVFDPFFTTRRDEGGTGMGLPIIRRMLEAQGAQIILSNGPGAVFEVWF